MVGFTPIFGLLGMLLGLVIGFNRGLHHGWLAVLGGASGGAVIGLIFGCIWALSINWYSNSLYSITKKIGESRRVLAEVMYWCGFALMFVVFMSPFVLVFRLLPKFH